MENTGNTQENDNNLTIQALIARIRELEAENVKLRQAIICQWLGVEDE